MFARRATSALAVPILPPGLPSPKRCVARTQRATVAVWGGALPPPPPKNGIKPLLQEPPGGGGIVWSPGQPHPTHPPTHIRRIFLQQKMKFIKGAGNLRPVSGMQTFWGL